MAPPAWRGGGHQAPGPARMALLGRPAGFNLHRVIANLPFTFCLHSVANAKSDETSCSGNAFPSSRAPSKEVRPSAKEGAHPGAAAGRRLRRGKPKKGLCRSQVPLCPPL